VALVSLSPSDGSGLNLALMRLSFLSPVLVPEAPSPFRRAAALVAAAVAELPDLEAEAPEADWGRLLAVAQICYGDYAAAEALPDERELTSLRAAVQIVEAGCEPDSGLEPASRGQWGLLALVGHGLLGEFQNGVHADKLPKVEFEHPAVLCACALASNHWLAVGSPGAGLLPEPYRAVTAEVVALVYDGAGASAERAEERYRKAMQAAVADPDSGSFAVALLGYAQLALRQRSAAWLSRRGA